MRLRKWLGWMLMAVVWAGPALAQESVGALLDMGGKKLTRDELVPLLSGTFMAGDSITQSGGKIGFTYQADGTVAGFSRMANGEEYRHTGLWTVNEAGKFCRDMTRMDGRRWKDCRFFFVHANAHFAAETDDRNAKAHKRVFEKK